MWTRRSLLLAFPLWMSFGRAEALTDPQICYILDGILFVYGIVLTALYCRIKILNARDAQDNIVKSKPKTEGVYMGLTPHAEDTYETIGTKK
ncbi:high affinity immunoglobulin epsilon receptor subunit gamma isoform X2 [Thalassophryne amazonica]|uniref:high affinity immunoglobulin epsilon receptor subunit gamma isoform X2 n=1 Tax=Thalassophryne amazonica TaxID=390379 RepID=UPI001471CE11|nr:high affinity immunoglobulin epsilon receptor subunit gamma isoform X2 [Thalassophryne amazonica]